MSKISSELRQPNFFIVGAAKSGTTSLWIYLKQHPDIFMPQAWSLKEPSYFCDLYGYNNFDAYLRLFADARNERAIGEASTSYLTSPESPDRIKKTYPAAKIIIMLRNPIERAYSLYNWMIKEGYEWETSFEKALIAEAARSQDQDFRNNNPQYYYNYLYFHSGEYATQIERYIEIFSPKNLLLLLYDDFAENPISIVQKVYDFLGVDNSFIPEIKIHNASQYILSVQLHYFVKRKLPLYLRGVSHNTIRKLQKILFSVNTFFGKRKKMNEKTRQELMQRYYANIKMTSNLTDYNLDHWLQ